jgi:hypothetical protein
LSNLALRADHGGRIIAGLVFKSIHLQHSSLQDLRSA